VKRVAFMAHDAHVGDAQRLGLFHHRMGTNPLPDSMPREARELVGQDVFREIAEIDEARPERRTAPSQLVERCREKPCVAMRSGRDTPARDEVGRELGVVDHGVYDNVIPPLGSGNEAGHVPAFTTRGLFGNCSGIAESGTTIGARAKGQCEAQLASDGGRTNARWNAKTPSLALVMEGILDGGRESGRVAAETTERSRTMASWRLWLDERGSHAVGAPFRRGLRSATLARPILFQRSLP